MEGPERKAWPAALRSTVGVEVWNQATRVSCSCNCFLSRTDLPGLMPHPLCKGRCGLCGRAAIRWPLWELHFWDWK